MKIVIGLILFFILADAWFRADTAQKMVKKVAAETTDWLAEVNERLAELEEATEEERASDRSKVKI